MTIQGLKVNCSPRFTRLLGADHHSMTPCDWCSDRDGLNDSELDILIEAGLHLFLSVDGYWYRRVVCYRSSIFVDEKSHGGPRHHGECLVFTYIERAASVIV